jgi:hypothetical protein
MSYNSLASLWVNKLHLRPYVACCVTPCAASSGRAELFAETMAALGFHDGVPPPTVAYFDDRQDNLDAVQSAHPAIVAVHVPDPLVLHRQVKDCLCKLGRQDVWSPRDAAPDAPMAPLLDYYPEDTVCTGLFSTQRDASQHFRVVE